VLREAGAAAIPMVTQYQASRFHPDIERKKQVVQGPFGCYHDVLGPACTSVTDSPTAKGEDLVQVASDEQRWKAVLARNSAQDGAFVYGVSSTGVYCRPSCPSRRPLRSRVAFFQTPDQAEAAGYRACRRCQPRARVQPAVRRIQVARQYLDQHPGETVTLERLGQLVGMSPYHLQRTFKRVVGVSPKAYVGARRIERMKSTLRQGHTVSRATYDAGYGSGSRAYEHASAGLGMTPGTYRKGGRGLRIAYSLVPTSVGQLLAAATDRGLCAVMLVDDATELENQLQGEYPAAALERNDTALSQYIGLILERLSGGEDAMLPLDVGGTAFQWQVWEALQRIPPGETRSYQTLAREIGRPTAARAVARACAGNHVALVIPCHRAVREHGEPGGYRWGAERKRQLLEQERAHRDSRSEVTVPA
jgi:AraC family transcriptional regulator of adaptative response/methylated-DNA-[protein]-cysteine methyltransferase